MARFLRSTATYKLRPPVVVSSPAGPPVQTEIRVLIAPSPVQARKAYSRLRPPVVVSPAVTFWGASTTYAPHPKQARLAHSKLRPPATLVAPVAPYVAAPPKFNYKTAVARSKEQHVITSILWPPMVVDPLPVTYGPSVTLARARKPPKTQASVKKPGVIAASIVFRAIMVKHAAVKPRADYAQRHFARWRLEPPTVLGAVLGFIAKPVKSLLAPSVPRQARGSRSLLRPPAVVAAAIVFRPLQVFRAKPSRPPATRSNLGRPSVLGAVAAAFIAPPLRIWRTLASRPPKTQGKLRAPSIIDPSIVFSPLRIIRAKAPKPPAVKSRLQPPSVVGAAVVAFIAVPVRVYRTFASRPPRTQARVRPPTIVTIFLAAPVRLTVVAVRTATDLIKRRPTSRLRPPPKILNPAIVFAPLRTVYRISVGRAVEVHKIGSKLRPPTVVLAFVAFLSQVFDAILGHPKVDSKPDEDDWQSGSHGNIDSSPHDQSFD